MQDRTEGPPAAAGWTLVATHGLVALASLSGCLTGESAVCRNGRICPTGTVCDEAHGKCVLGQQLTVCVGQPDGASCAYPGAPVARCFQEVCFSGICGNGLVEGQEECDEGPSNSDEPDATCRTWCVRRACGDGIVDGVRGESCDAASSNSDEPDATCRSDCTPARCGDGIVDALRGEVCDDGPLNSDDPAASCPSSCGLPSCGDGVVVADEGEECDDGNQDVRDGCAYCRWSRPELQVNVGTEGYIAAPEIAVSHDSGSFMVTWGISDGTAMVRAFDDTGAPKGTEWVAGALLLQDLASLGDGEAVIAGLRYGVGFLSRRFDDTGAPLGDESLVNDVGPSELWSAPSVASASDGRFVIAYVGSSHPSQDQPRVFWKRFAADGLPASPENQAPDMESQDEYWPDIGLAEDGQVVLVFFSGGYGRYGWNVCCYSPTDEPVGNCVHVVTSTSTTPRVSVASAGHFVVTYYDFDEASDLSTIWIRAYDATCSPTINPVNAIGSSRLTATESAVGIAADGSFVVAWQGYDTALDQHGVYARRFEFNGVPKGPEQRMDRLEGRARSPSIAVFPDGSFASAWLNYDQDVDGFGLFVQRFGADGLPAGMAASGVAR